MVAARIPAPRASAENRGSGRRLSGIPAAPSAENRGSGRRLSGIPAPRASAENAFPARRRRQDAPPAPLGSLTQRDHRAGASCTACASTHVTRLTMNLTDGTPVDFVSCHRCEHRSWQHAGGPLGVDAVLEHARKR